MVWEQSCGVRCCPSLLRPPAPSPFLPAGVPCELVEFLDPCTPLLLGGLGQSEEKMGLMKLRLKRPRWFPKVWGGGDLAGR